jgi:diguanylate cyclase (GGDEF)-like protein
MKCERALELISARIDREIIFENEALDEHLEGCADCREELDAMRRLESILWQAHAPEREEAEVLADKVLASLQKRGRHVNRCTVLLVDDHKDVLITWRGFLNDEFDVLIAGSAREAQSYFAQHEIDIVLTDQKMPEWTGVELLEWVQTHYPRTQRLLWTAYGDLDNAVDAVNRAGVFRYLLKGNPTSMESVVREALRDAARVLQLEREYQRVLRELSELNVQLEERVRQRTRQLEEANRELEQRTQTLEKFALTDALTLLPNRKALDHFVDRELYLCRRFPAPMAVAIIDVDFFKDINRDFNHTGGDFVLRELARCMSATLRKIDVLGRWAGDEFMLIAPQTQRAGALVLAERLRTVVQNHPFNYLSQGIPVTIAIGLAVIEAGRSPDYERVKVVAANALKKAKANGRNCVEIEAVVPPPAHEEGPGESKVASA